MESTGSSPGFLNNLCRTWFSSMNFSAATPSGNVITPHNRLPVGKNLMGFTTTLFS